MKGQSGISLLGILTEELSEIRFVSWYIAARKSISLLAVLGSGGACVFDHNFNHNQQKSEKCPQLKVNKRQQGKVKYDIRRANQSENIGFYIWDHQAAGSNLVTRATKKRQFSQENSVFLQLLEEKYKTYLTLDHLSYFDAFWGFIKQLPQKYGEFYHSINETLIILDISFDHN